MKILIASDSSTYSEYLSFRLHREGHETCLVRDGLEAINLLKQEPWNLLIIGIALNYLTGLEVIKQLRDFIGSLPAEEQQQRKEYLSMKIIIATRIRNEEIRKNAYILGANSYLLLPLKTSELLEKIG